MIRPLSPWARRWVGRIIVIAAVIGTGLGALALARHLATDPLSDVRAYYDAAARLNAGLPLYEQTVDTDDPAFYRYPPLLAIAFRPLAAALPFETAALAWEAIVIGTFVATLVRLGIRRRPTWIALAILSGATAWAIVIGQAQVVVTFLLALGTPWAVAVAANLKLLPALAAVWWVGRRDLRSLARFGLVMLALAAAQVVLEPSGTFAYLGFIRLDQVGQVANLSPYAISPVLWAALVVVGGLAALRLAPTRYGWAAAVAFSVLATPRLLQYQLATLVAGLREPAEPPAQRVPPHG
jgi:hypothetical protein